MRTARLGRRVARLNRAPNRLFRVVASWLPGFRVVVHRGRKSGLVYRTPVKLFRQGQRSVIACIYGTESGWVKNVAAAGGCELPHLGGRTSLEAVEIVRDESRRLVPPLVRRVFRLLRAADFVLLEPATAGSARAHDRAVRHRAMSHFGLLRGLIRDDRMADLVERVRQIAAIGATG